MKTALSVIIFVLAASLAAGPSGTAFADPPEPGNASCFGYEASGVSPPGSFPVEAPGGMPDLLEFLDTVVIPTLDLPNRGAAISFAAKLHLGSHADCDEFLEGLLGGE
jgi:hypothetical protein